MSTSDSTIKGKMDEIAGKTKQALGDLTGNQGMANHGAAQEVKGHTEQAWGSVKEAAYDSQRHDPVSTNTVADTEAHNARQGVTSAAANMKQHIKNAVDDFKK